MSCKRKLSKGPNPPMPLPTEEELTRGPIQSDLANYLLRRLNTKMKNYGVFVVEDWREVEVYHHSFLPPPGSEP